MKAQNTINGYPKGFNINDSNLYSSFEKWHNLPYMKYFMNEDYLVSTWGRVYCKNTASIVPNIIRGPLNNYKTISMQTRFGTKENVQIHRLISYAFISPLFDTDLIANHKDGVKWHNEPYNLEWMTMEQNIQHANKENLINRVYGEDNGWSVLTDEQYTKICELTQQGYFPAQINIIMNVGKDITNICQKIRDGKSETFISQNYDFSNIPRNDYRKFTEDQVRQICMYLQDNPDMKYIDIIRNLGYDVDNMEKRDIKKLRDTISTIKRRVSYVEIGKDYDF